MSESWSAGNAADDSQETRGWFIGEFINPSTDMRASKDIEAKWMRHPVGDKRADPSADAERDTLAVLMSGRFRIDLAEQTHVLTNPGDYLVWERGLSHTWEALEESVVMTVRWRSSE